MWDKLKDFTESHYRGVLAFNFAVLLFIGTAVFYGVIAVRDISTYDEIIVKADLQPTTVSTDDWFSEAATEEKEEPTVVTEPTKPKEQSVMVDLYDVIEKFLPEGSIPDSKSLKELQTSAKEIASSECYRRYRESFLNDRLISTEYMTLVSVCYADTDSEHPEAFCELSRGESSYYFRITFEESENNWQITDWKRYA